MANKRFIYKFVDKVRFRFNSLKTFIARLKQLNLAELESDTEQHTVSMAFTQWFMDVALYGLELMFIYVTVFVLKAGFWKWFCLVFAVGLMRWLFLDFVRDFRGMIR